jgi:hypothetical protein
MATGAAAATRSSNDGFAGTASGSKAVHLRRRGRAFQRYQGAVAATSLASRPVK